MLGTGLRRGEALAFGLDDLDLDVGAARVRYTLGRVNGALVRSEPKTEKSRRTVPLPAPVVTAPRAHRKQRVADQLRAGSEWQDSGLVFTTAYGAPLDPRNVLRAFASVAERAGLSGAGLHTLPSLLRDRATRTRRPHAGSGRAAWSLVLRGHGRRVLPRWRGADAGGSRPPRTRFRTVTRFALQYSLQY